MKNRNPTYKRLFVFLLFLLISEVWHVEKFNGELQNLSNSCLPINHHTEKKSCDSGENQWCDWLGKFSK